MHTTFVWKEQLESLCDAPLESVEATELDAGHPARSFLGYWEGLNGGKVPDRSAFDPKSVPSLLKWLMLFRRELQDGEDVYHLFLQGTSAAEMTHGLLQGQYLHEFTSVDCYDTRRGTMRHVLTTLQPAFARISIAARGEYRTNATVGMFPFMDKDEWNVFVVPAPESLEIRALI